MNEDAEIMKEYEDLTSEESQAEDDKLLKHYCHQSHLDQEQQPIATGPDTEHEAGQVHVHVHEQESGSPLFSLPSDWEDGQEMEGIEGSGSPSHDTNTFDLPDLNATITAPPILPDLGATITAVHPISRCGLRPQDKLRAPAQGTPFFSFPVAMVQEWDDEDNDPEPAFSP
ncbi:hypothetical protein PQX77_013892 [Marasmius sp. AFHP31]|nr:hypothetical protein PQX77_013892 [Marasmius sp. AFHP31]